MHRYDETKSSYTTRKEIPPSRTGGFISRREKQQEEVTRGGKEAKRSKGLFPEPKPAKRIRGLPAGEGGEGGSMPTLHRCAVPVKKQTPVDPAPALSKERPVRPVANEEVEISRLRRLLKEKDRELEQKNGDLWEAHDTLRRLGDGSLAPQDYFVREETIEHDT
ncbi:hypothetical protein R1sor_025960 [Riccia sorocarpa]|uniref:Uncharacterized protein n=1 Tax=Riccia sorocarpa TaxID=122646 RepID=A0ABD3GCU4_9MARC